MHFTAVHFAGYEGSIFHFKNLLKCLLFHCRLDINFLIVFIILGIFNLNPSKFWMDNFLNFYPTCPFFLFQISWLMIVFLILILILVLCFWLWFSNSSYRELCSDMTAWLDPKNTSSPTSWVTVTTVTVTMVMVTMVTGSWNEFLHPQDLVELPRFPSMIT